MLCIAVIKLADNTYLHFGPFPDYHAANDFAQAKFAEYIDAKSAYVEGLIAPALFPDRKV